MPAARSPVGRLLRDIFAVEQHGARLRPVEARQAIEQAALARPVRPDHRMDRTPVHREIDRAQSLNRAETQFERTRFKHRSVRTARTAPGIR